MPTAKRRRPSKRTALLTKKGLPRKPRPNTTNNPAGRPALVPEKRLRAPRTGEIVIDWSKLRPIVAALFREMAQQGMGFAGLSHVSGVSFATIQKWSKGTLPTIPALEKAFAALGHEIWSVRVRPVEQDYSVVDSLLIRPDAQKRVMAAIGDGWSTTAEIIARLAPTGHTVKSRSVRKVLNVLLENGAVEKRSDANMAAWRRTQQIAIAA